MKWMKSLEREEDLVKLAWLQKKLIRITMVVQLTSITYTYQDGREFDTHLAMVLGIQQQIILLELMFMENPVTTTSHGRSNMMI